MEIIFVTVKYLLAANSFRMTAFALPKFSCSTSSSIWHVPQEREQWWPYTTSCKSWRLLIGFFANYFLSLFSHTFTKKSTFTKSSLFAVLHCSSYVQYVLFVSKIPGLPFPLCVTKIPTVSFFLFSVKIHRFLQAKNTIFSILP